MRLQSYFSATGVGSFTFLGAMAKRRAFTVTVNVGSHQRSQDLTSHGLIHLMKRSMRMILAHEENTIMHFMAFIALMVIFILILHHPYRPYRFIIMFSH